MWRRAPSAKAVSPNSGCASLSSPLVATALCCAPRRRLAAGRCSTPRRRAPSTRTGSSCSNAATRPRSSARSCASPSPARPCRRAGSSLQQTWPAAPRRSNRLAANDLVRLDDRQLAEFLEAEGRLKRVGDGLAVSTELYERGREALHELAPITLAGFRDALGISRKTAQLLLERFDADGLTRRVGDERVLRRKQGLPAGDSP